MNKRGPKRKLGRLQRDLVIYTRLSMAEPDKRELPGRVFVDGRELPQPESVSQAARDLANEWKAGGYNMDWEVIRARYNKLKKARTDPDAVKGSF